VIKAIVNRCHFERTYFINSDNYGKASDKALELFAQEYDASRFNHKAAKVQLLMAFIDVVEL
jgi:hypothetical protein